MSTTPQWAVMPAIDYENTVAAIKQQTGNDTPLLSGQLAGEIMSITAKPVPVNNCDYLFQNNRRLDEIDKFDLSEVTSAAYMFDCCNELQTIPESLNLSKATDCENIFNDVDSIVEYGDLVANETLKLTNAFNSCDSLKRFGNIIAPKCKNANGMLSRCSRLETIGSIDLSDCESAGWMFSYCGVLNGNIVINNTKPLVADGIITGCSQIKNITINGGVTGSCYGITSRCSMLESVELGDTSGATNWQEAFFECRALKHISKLDFTNATTILKAFYNAPINDLEVVFGTKLVNASQAFNSKNLKDLNASGELGITISFGSSPLTAESAISVINCLVDYSGTDKDLTQTITFSATTKTALNALGNVAPNGLTWLEYAQSKGWTV